ncbi:hypothetical protein H257_08386 [Aphanomyces astaci]|uniref:Uncharacterized protein n=1 Tax=Aphanomyces astaci TaxID=112090 RepID=W4GG07_APHAT|nr:hypothetical protein H257_08386 [Aphanomyces astaci]ETV78201.1 hypothetical protein H257_08386 [Aphanomyces astaci]|eukprot:XP_009832538.1 hypothetical protein H257_08386 [Aphanomyces astaci]
MDEEAVDTTTATTTPPQPTGEDLSSKAGDARASTDQSTDLFRRRAGDLLSSLSSTLDDNVMLFRWGCMATMVGCAYISIRSSGLLTRYTSLDALPVGVPVVGRVLGQHAADPSTLYVYHTPWVRRVLLKETLPRGMDVSGHLTDTSSVIAVRPFGVDMQDEAKRWLYSDFVAARRYVTIELLYRPPPPLSSSSSTDYPPAVVPPTPTLAVGACSISTPKNLFFRQDMAEFAVARGIAVCRPEPDVDVVKPNMSRRSIKRLERRTKRLASRQEYAQTMRYGVWKEWAEPEVAQRMVSAGKRASTAAMQRIFGTWWTKY